MSVPVVIVASGAPPFVSVASGGFPASVVASGGMPVTLVASGAPPITLDNPLYAYGVPAFLFDVPLSQYKNGSSFVTSFSSLSGLTFTRASIGYAQTSAGVLQQFASGAPRITDKGILIEGARTNKCTNYNAVPPALFTPGAVAAFNAAVFATQNISGSGGDGNTLFGIVDDSAAIAAAGLSAIVTNGRVIKIDNSTGAATAFVVAEGTTANTNAHTVSVYVRVETPASFAPVTLTGVSATAVSITDSYRRVSEALTPGAGTNKLTLRCPAGSVAYFILNQLEEASFVSSPIPVAGASATRAADVCSIAVSGISYPATLFAEFERVVDTGVVEGLLNFDDGTSSERALLYVSSSDRFSSQAIAAAGSVYDQTAGPNPLAIGTVYRGAARFQTNDFRNACAGTLGNLDTAGAVPSGTNLVRLGTITGGSTPCFGYIKRAAIWSNLAFTDAQLQAVTA